MASSWRTAFLASLTALPAVIVGLPVDTPASLVNASDSNAAHGYRLPPILKRDGDRPVCDQTCVYHVLYQTAHSATSSGIEYAISIFNSQGFCFEQEKAWCPDVVESATTSIAARSSYMQIDYDNCDEACLLVSMAEISRRGALYAMQWAERTFAPESNDIDEEAYLQFQWSMWYLSEQTASVNDGVLRGGIQPSANSTNVAENPSTVDNSTSIYNATFINSMSGYRASDLLAPYLYGGGCPDQYLCEIQNFQFISGVLKKARSSHNGTTWLGFMLNTGGRHNTGPKPTFPTFVNRPPCPGCPVPEIRPQTPPPHWTPEVIPQQPVNPHAPEVPQAPVVHDPQLPVQQSSPGPADEPDPPRDNKQREEDERKKGEEEKKKAEEQSNKAEEERRKAEEEGKKVEEERKKAEDEKNKADEDQKRLEDERNKTDGERRKADEESKQAENARKKAEEEKLKAEEEHRKAEDEGRASGKRKKAEEELKRAEEMRKEAEDRRIKADEEVKKMEEQEKEQREKTEQERKDVEDRQRKADEELKRVEERQRKADYEMKKVDEELKRVNEQPKTEGPSEKAQGKKPVLRPCLKEPCPAGTRPPVDPRPHTQPSRPEVNLDPRARYRAQLYDPQSGVMKHSELGDLRFAPWEERRTYDSLGVGSRRVEQLSKLGLKPFEMMKNGKGTKKIVWQNMEDVVSTNDGDWTQAGDHFFKRVNGRPAINPLGEPLVNGPFGAAPRSLQPTTPQRGAHFDGRVRYRWNIVDPANPNSILESGEAVEDLIEFNTRAALRERPISSNDIATGNQQIQHDLEGSGNGDLHHDWDPNERTPTRIPPETHALRPDQSSPFEHPDDGQPGPSNSRKPGKLSGKEYPHFDGANDRLDAHEIEELKAGRGGRLPKPSKFPKVRNLQKLNWVSRGSRIMTKLAPVAYHAGAVDKKAWLIYGETWLATEFLMMSQAEGDAEVWWHCFKERMNPFGVHHCGQVDENGAAIEGEDEGPFENFVNNYFGWAIDKDVDDDGELENIFERFVQSFQDLGDQVYDFFDSSEDGKGFGENVTDVLANGSFTVASAFAKGFTWVMEKGEKFAGWVHRTWHKLIH